MALSVFAVTGSQKAARAETAFNDLTFGRTMGGSLRSESGQFLCFDASDAMRGAYRASDTPADDQVRSQLIASRRCTSIPAGTAFSMTADGRERFVTPHGAVELWAA